MDYIDLNLTGKPIPMRDMKGQLHSYIGAGPGGCDVEQTKSHHQIIQRCRYPDGRLVVSYFEEHGSTIRKVRGDVTFQLHHTTT